MISLILFLFQLVTHLRVTNFIRKSFEENSLVKKISNVFDNQLRVDLLNRYFTVVNTLQIALQDYKRYILDTLGLLIPDPVLQEVLVIQIDEIDKENYLLKIVPLTLQKTIKLFIFTIIELLVEISIICIL